jgi:hypothetical protein
MASSRYEYDSDAQWLENEIAELNAFSELAQRRALQADCDERNRQLTEVASKLRARANRLTNILELLKAAKLRP